MGPAIDVFFNISGGRCQTHRRCPPGSHHRRLLQHWWWPLLDPLAAPPRGLPSTSSSTLVVDTAGPADSSPRGPAIDVFFNLGGGCFWTHRQCPQVACNRCLLQHWWWMPPDPSAVPPEGLPSTSSSTSVVDAAEPTGSAPRGPAIDVFFNLDVLQQVVAIASIYYQHLPGATVVNYH
jgi:hypothetical protein